MSGVDNLTRFDRLVSYLETMISGSGTVSGYLGVLRTVAQQIEDQFGRVESMVNQALAFSTHAEMLADTTQTADTLARVWNDSNASLNGIYGWDGTAWILSGLDDRRFDVPKIRNALRNGNKPEELTVYGVAGAESTNKEEFARHGIQSVARLNANATPYVYLDFNLDDADSDKYCVASFLIFSETGDFPDGNIGYYQGESFTRIASNYLRITPTMRLFYADFKLPAQNSLRLGIGCMNADLIGNDMLMSGWAYALSNDEIGISDLNWSDFGSYQSTDELASYLESKAESLDSGLSKRVETNFQNSVFLNAVIDRYNQWPDSKKVLGYQDNVIRRVVDDQSFYEFGDIRVTQTEDNVDGYGLRLATLVSPDDLSKIGVMPNDSQPPIISIKASIIKHLTENTGIDNPLQIWFMLRYGGDLKANYNTDENILFKKMDGTAEYLGAGDAQFDHIVEKYEDELSLGWCHNGVPVPATYNGRPFSGVVILGFGFSNNIQQQKMAMGNIAIVKGESIDYKLRYLNTPDDSDHSFVVRDKMFSESLAADFEALKSGVVIDRVDIKSSDKIVIAGDSYSESIYTPRDKAYISILSSLTDWRLENYSLGGDDLLEINHRMLLNSPKFHASLGIKDYGGTYCILISYTNDAGYRSEDLDYYLENLERLIQTTRSIGMEPIVASEWLGEPSDTAAIRSTAVRNGVRYFDVLEEAKDFTDSWYMRFFGEGHPGVRNNSLMWSPLLNEVRALPRPKKGMKLYRPRVLTTNKQDLVYNNIQQRLYRWKEISIGHKALQDAHFYDSLDQNYAKENIDSEYLALQNHDSVDFQDFALIEAILPASSDNIGWVELLLSDSSVAVYALDNLAPPSFDATEPVKPPVGYADTVGVPRGNWVQIDNVDGRYCFSSDSVCRFVKYDKLVLLVEKSGVFSLNDIHIDVQCIPGKSSQPEQDFIPRPMGRELLFQPYIGTAEQLQSWVVSQNIAITQPVDNNLPRGCIGLVEVTDTKVISQGLQTLSDEEGKDGCITIWARTFPPLFEAIPENYPDAAPINSDTVDFSNLMVSIGHTNSKHKMDLRQLVGIGWTEIRIPWRIPIDLTEKGYEITLSSSDSTPIQISKVSIKSVI